LPIIKFEACSHSLYAPVTDDIIRQHLRGDIAAGRYPLLVDNRCHFLTLDFDDADWREDSRAVLQIFLDNAQQAPLLLKLS
jgi:hypothetical protein